MASAAQAPVTVGYWAIKGLGAPLRMMAMYANVPVNCELYECTEGSEPGSFNRDSWLVQAKPALKERNPLINLPYVIDTDGSTVVTQSNACFLFLGRKLDLLGDGSPQQLCACEQLLCEATDLRNQVVGYAYSARATSAEETQRFFKSASFILEKLEGVLKAKKTTDSLDYFVGGKASAPDFHIWELLDQLSRIAVVHALPSPLEGFPLLGQFHRSFAELPNNARYLASPLHQLPMNNTSAKVGAVPEGGAWVPGQVFSWAGRGGVY